MKKKFLAVMLSSVLVLSGCWFNDLINWFKKEPEQQQEVVKTITKITKVEAPSMVEQGTQLNKDDFRAFVEYSDGSTGKVTVDSFSLDTSVVGDAVQGSVTVGSLTASFTIKVYSNQIDNHSGTYSNSEYQAGDGYADMSLKDGENNDSVKIRFDNGSVKNNSLTLPTNSNVVISNELEAPLTGINQLSLSFTSSESLSSSETLVYAIYFSYNYLTIEDIMSGYYSDLEVKISSAHASSTSFGIDAPSNVKARYFLIVLQTPSIEFKVVNPQLQTGTSAPSAVAKGTFQYKDEDKFLFRGFDNGLPYIGNGSFIISKDSSDQRSFSTVQKPGKYEFMLTKFAENGFRFATTVMGMNVYQKPASDGQYYTYAISIQNCPGYECFTILDAGLKTNLIEVTSWPGDDIKSLFSDNSFKGKITDPGFVGNVSYILSKEISAGEKEAGLLLNLKDGTREQYVSNYDVLKNYIHKFANDYGYNIVDEYEKSYDNDSFYYIGSAKSVDQRYEISAQLSYDIEENAGYVTLSFIEKVFTSFPINEVRNFIGDSNFPVLLSDEGSFSLKTSPSSLNITAIDVTMDELNAYTSKLVEYGLSASTPYHSESGGYYYWSANMLKINSEGAFNYNVYFYVYDSGYSSIEYRRSNAYSRTNINSALMSIDYTSSRRNEFSDALGETFANGEFVTDSSSKTIYCMNFGESEAQLVRDICTFDTCLGYFVYTTSNDNGVYLLDIEVASNYVALKFITIYQSYWSTYVEAGSLDFFNSYIDTSLTSFGHGDISPTYHMSDTSYDVKCYQSNIYEIDVFGRSAKEALQDYLDALVAAGIMRYSRFLDMYINTEHRLGFSVTERTSGGIPCCSLHLSPDAFLFVDYDTYNHYSSDFNYFGHTDLYPSILNVIDANDPVIVVDPFSSDTFMYVSLLNETDFKSYVRLLQNDSRLTEVESGRLFVSVDEDGNKFSITCSKEGKSYMIYYRYDANYYTSISEVVEAAINEGRTEMSEFLMPDTTANSFRGRYDVYPLIVEYDQIHYNPNGYINSLLANNYIEFESDRYAYRAFAKLVGNKSYIVYIGERNKEILYEVREYTATSYDSLVNQIESSGFDVDKLDNFVKIPSMEDSYFYVSSIWGNNKLSGFEVAIINSEFDVNEYTSSLISAGFTYNETSKAYEKGSDINVTLGCYYGFVTINYEDTRLLYKSLNNVVNTAVKNGFYRWRLEYFDLPSQEGNLYAYDHCTYDSIYINYSEDFDVAAYKAELVEKGYSLSTDTYEKESSYVHFVEEENYFVIQYVGNAITSEFYFDSLAIDNGYTFSSDPLYPEEALGLEVTSCYCNNYSGYYEYYLNFNNNIEESIKTAVANNEVVTEFVTYGYYGYLKIIDLSKYSASTSVASILSNFGLDVTYWEGHSALESNGIKHYSDYYSSADANQLLATITAVVQANVGNYVVSYDASTPGVLTFRISNSTSSPTFRFELLSNNVFTVSAIYSD